MQVELFEMVLVHLPTKTLGRALSLSKHCRTVILGNQQLRQRLFLEPTQATEYLETDKWISVAVRSTLGIPGTIWVRHEAIFQELRPDSQDSRIIVEAHPILEVRSEFEHRTYGNLFKSIYQAWHNSFPGHEPVPFMQTMSLCCEAVKMIPAQTLLFQPPVTEVKMYHHGALILLRRSEGVTFGTVAEQFKKMDAEYDQHFRKRDERIIQDCTLRPVRPHVSVSKLRVLFPKIPSRYGLQGREWIDQAVGGLAYTSPDHDYWQSWGDDQRGNS